MSNCSGCGCKEAIVINQCQDYLSADNMALCLSSQGCYWPDGMTDVQLCLAPVNAGCGCPFNTGGTVAGVLSIDDCGVARACFELTCRETCSLTKGTHIYNFKLTAKTVNGGNIVINSGHVTVK